LFAQKKIFTVYDSTTSSIIPYANIWKENKIYANADANGYDGGAEDVSFEEVK
jgi:chitodextrinase